MNYTFLTNTSAQLDSKSVVTIGNFDGVHCGHQRIFAKVVDIAAAKQITPLAFSFYPHPREVLGNIKVALITTVLQRSNKIAKLFPKIKYGKIDFDLALAQKSARAFLQILIDEFAMSDLVIGTTTHIGKNREGTPERIAQLAKSMGFTLHLIEPLKVGEHVVSSTLIRNLITKGEVERVVEVMGEFFTTSGEVIHGQQLGGALGFPTANVACFSSQLLPANGVYAVWAWVNGKRYPGAANLGYRPTLEQDNVTRHLEVHLLNQEMNLYGSDMTVAWVQKIRDEKKFNSLKMLQKQVSLDVIKINKILSK
ncbi:MAG: riboflavin biosynthesis protein RibF [Deltaproteobacteria bacterium]|nr:riboflavin biosynthesis protein RibF [Deltaproteobacteria bacterium]